MKNLFESSSAVEIRKRIGFLTPDSERQWGVMNAAQMLAHCSAWMEIAAGLKCPPRSFVGRIFGKMAKKSFSRRADPAKHALREELDRARRGGFCCGAAAFARLGQAFFGGRSGTMYDTPALFFGAHDFSRVGPSWGISISIII